MAGLLLAAGINHFVRTIKLPTDVALLFDLRIDWRVIAFTLVLSLATGVLFSLVPALQASKPELVPALKDQSSMGGFRRSRLRNALVIGQVALSLILLVSAGLIVLAFMRQALEGVRALPGVRSVALTENLPLSLNYNSSTIYLEGQPVVSSSVMPLAIPTSVSPGYFETMGIPLRGRDFHPHEDKTESRVAVVNETFARRFFPAGDAIGKRFNFSGPDKPFWEIIGIAGDGKYNSLAEPAKSALFRPIFRDDPSGVTVVARTLGNPQALLNAMRREVQGLEPTMPLYQAKDVD